MHSRMLQALSQRKDNTAESSAVKRRGGGGDLALVASKRISRSTSELSLGRARGNRHAARLNRAGCDVPRY